MRNINVPVEDAVYDAAKVSAARAGMLFRKWVERAIADAADGGIQLQTNNRKPGDTLKLREPHYEPID